MNYAQAMTILCPILSLGTVISHFTPGCSTQGFPVNTTEYITTESHMLVGLWKMHWYHGQQVWLLIDHDDSTLKILKSNFSTEHIKATKVIS